MEYLALIVVSVFTLIYVYFKYAFGYWKRKHVECVDPSFPFGNMENPIFRKNGIFKDLADVYFKLKTRGCKYGGFYTTNVPTFVPIHADLVKNIMAKDFNHFVNHGMYFNEKDDPLSAHLFAIEDEKWRNLRAKLTPTFTSGKMKMMFHTLKNCSVPLVDEIDKLTNRKEALDIKELVARFSTDVIGSCAFGIDCNSFKDPDAEFRKFGKRAFEIDFITNVRMFLILALPKLAKFFEIRNTKEDVSSFFLDMVANTVKYRENSNYTRSDFMQLLIELKNKETDGLTLNEISAQAFVFFLAGFETSSTTASFCFYELAQNQDIQEKVRQEINTVLANHKGEITYDALQEMKYLGQVIDETLRKYPPVPILTRRCNKTYQVPDSDVIIEDGTSIFIPSYAIHHDPEYYPEPERFNPDRFSDENKRTHVPYTFIPFGEGPRVCIGLRFGVMQTKISLVTILKNFRLKLNKQTSPPLKFDPNSFVLSFKESILLDSEKIA